MSGMAIPIKIDNIGLLNGAIIGPLILPQVQEAIDNYIIRLDQLWRKGVGILHLHCVDVDFYIQAKLGKQLPRGGRLSDEWSCNDGGRD